MRPLENHFPAAPGYQQLGDNLLTLGVTTHPIKPIPNHYKVWVSQRCVWPDLTPINSYHLVVG